jgi:hypothetical protein
MRLGELNAIEILNRVPEHPRGDRGLPHVWHLYDCFKGFGFPMCPPNTTTTVADAHRRQPRRSPEVSLGAPLDSVFGCSGSDA